MEIKNNLMAEVIFCHQAPRPTASAWLMELESEPASALHQGDGRRCYLRAATEA
jgi:hypothetical protein